ncbi:MAG: fibronectin type protein [Acidimicrobiales bacterium]|nr:fibronectin type protein [Acidimicrobiales bacterium]
MLAAAIHRSKTDPTQRGFTLVELMVAMVVTAIIMGAIASAFITGLKTTSNLGASNTGTSDINLLSTYFPADVMSMAGPTYDPASPPPRTAISPDGYLEGLATAPQTICGADPLDEPDGRGIYSFNSQWNALTAKFERTVTYSAEGTGADAKLVRRQCTPGASPVMLRTVVAEHFGSRRTNDRANALVGITCLAKTCTLEVNGQDSIGRGTYDYKLTARRRVPGIAAVTHLVPCAPTAPSATPGFQENFVQWQKPVCDGGDPITLYEVRDTPPGTSNLFGPTVFAHTYTGLNNGSSYTYEVRAQNANGWSAWSARSIPGVPAFSTPGPPTVTGSVPGNKKLTISWVAPASDGGRPITGYVIRATNESGDVVSAPVSGPVGTGVVVGLQNGNPDPTSLVGAYSITVAAVNSVGEGRESEPFGPNQSTKPLSGKPDPPKSVVATAQQDVKGHVTVTWTEPLDDGGSTLTGYEVSSSLGGTPITIVGNFFTTEVNNLPMGTPITFFVRGCNVAGCGSPSVGSNTVTLTWGPEKITPAPILRGTGIAGQGQLSWTAPSANGSPITGYRIVLDCVTACGSGAANRNGEVTLTHSTGTTYTLISQPAGSVRYTVAALNARNPLGPYTPSDPSNTDTLGAAPNPATNLVATATGIQGQASLSFTPPTNTGGRPVVNYVVNVYQALDNLPTSFPNTMTPMGAPFPVTSPDASSPILINNLPVGYFYKFKLSTYNGVDTSQKSAFSTAAKMNTVPNPPTNVVATDPLFDSSGLAHITFTPAVQPAGTPVVTGFTVTCQSCSPTISQNVADTAGSGVNVGSATEGNSKKLPSGVPLVFTVHATNAPTVGIGAESAPSAPVTIYGAPTAPLNVLATSTGASGSVMVSWSPPATDHGLPVTGYTIQICAPSDCTVASGAAKHNTTEAAGSASPYLVTGLDNGVTYTFKVSAVNAKNPSARSVGATAIPATNPTSPVIGIAEATGVSGQAIVRWTPPTNNGGNAITGYRVTASTGEVFDVSGAATTSLTVNGLVDGPSITFTVQAVNAVGPGAASAPSNAVITGTVPGAPTQVLATATKVSGQITVQWSAAPANGPAVTQHTVTVHCTCAQDGTTATAVGNATSLLMSGLSDGQTYTFTVRATNPFGPGPDSDPSNEAAPIGVPDAPTDVLAEVTSSSGTVIVSWTAPPDHGSPVATYTVFASTGAVLPNVTDTVTTFSGLDDGVPVTFTVQALNDAGPSALSAPSNSVSPRGLPDAPTSVVAIPTGVAGQVSISWTVPDDHSSAITGYHILDSNGVETIVGPGSSTLISGLDEGTPVSFTVAAINDAGQGPDATPTAAVTPAGVPDAPANVVATVTAAGTVTLTFDAPNGHGAAVTGYTVTISCGGGTCTRNGQQQAITSGGTITGLGEGGTASFAVVAINSSGSGLPGTSNTVGIPTKPGAPTGVTAVLTGLRAQVTVSWTPPASDGGAPITSYELVSNNTSQTFTVPAPASTFTVPRASLILNGAIADNVPVSFKLRAVNMVGQSLDSNSSAVVTLPTTNSAPAAASITITATGTSGQVDVSWTAPATNGRSPIVGYHVTILATGGAKNNTVVDTVVGFPAVTTLRISGLTVGKTYTFRVTTRNDVYPPPPAATRSGISAGYVMT